MDSDRRSGQVERLEVVDTGRRRRWSETIRIAEAGKLLQRQTFDRFVDGMFAPLQDILDLEPARGEAEKLLRERHDVDGCSACLMFKQKIAQKAVSHEL
jgi:hypothetical protein